MRRLSVLLAVVILGITLPASAKMPPFDMEVERRGSTVDITVTVSDESMIHDFDMPHLDGLIAILPGDQVDEGGRPLYALGEKAAVRLHRVEAGTFRGSVSVEPGRWAVVPFPDITDLPPGGIEVWYPDTVVVEVGDEQRGMRWLAATLAVMVLTWQLRHIAPLVVVGRGTG